MQRFMILSLVAMSYVSGSLSAQEHYSAPLAQSGQPDIPKMNPPMPPPGYMPTPRGDPTIPNPLDRLFSNPFAQATEAGGQPSRTFNENFDGDFGGVFYKQRITTGFTTVPQVIGVAQRLVGFTQQTTTSVQIVEDTDQELITQIITNTTTNIPIFEDQLIFGQTVVEQQQIVRRVLAARYSGILITDNDSPRPQDRIYFGYGFYDNIGGALNPGVGNTDLQRQLFGFEKTFLNGDASFGMRLPFVQQYGPGAGTHYVGDLTLLTKYAIINDVDTGNLWSVGFVLTTPTGSGSITLYDGTKAPHSVLFQPWTGVVRVFERGYVQGITSMVIPSDSRDPTLFNNSIGMGMFAYRAGPERWLTAIVPTTELHVRTPLNNRNPQGLVYLQDQVNVTSGMHFRFGRSTLSAAVCVPLVGPRPFAVEAISFLNISF